MKVGSFFAFRTDKGVVMDLVLYGVAEVSQILGVKTVSFMEPFEFSNR